MYRWLNCMSVLYHCAATSENLQNNRFPVVLEGKGYICKFVPINSLRFILRNLLLFDHHYYPFLQFFPFFPFYCPFLYFFSLFFLSSFYFASENMDAIPRASSWTVITYF